MQVGKQRPWKWSIQAKAEKFNFKLKATNILPTWKFDRFSLLLRLNKFIINLQLKSGSTISVSAQQKRTLKSRFLGFLEKIRIRRARKALSIQYPEVKSICGGSLLIGILASLLQSISRKDLNGIVVHSSIIL
ncbi:hypothetical protein CCACVL1_00483, partial [Corchorus capsularis]